METDVILIGKVIKEIKHVQPKKKTKTKNLHEIFFEMVLMCDSNKL